MTKTPVAWAMAWASALWPTLQRPRKRSSKRPYLTIKDLRDGTYALMGLALLAFAGAHAEAWFMLAVAFVPLGDALIVCATAAPGPPPSASTSPPPCWSCSAPRCCSPADIKKGNRDMTTLSHVLAITGVLTAWKKIDDRTLVMANGFMHYYGDRRFPIPGILSVAATVLTAMTSAISGHWPATASPPR